MYVFNFILKILFWCIIFVINWYLINIGLFLLENCEILILLVN